ncbi:MAG: MGMT family protein [Micropruina sp.]|uniref:MGMT family protein n=1 Tax=Micropruina sp. TaxID=2737536 RepID=UPI0039E300F2
MDDFLVDRVLLAVEQIPAGRVTSYGDIARLVGTGPRQVGGVLSRYGADVPWWRVTGQDGTMASGLIERARQHWAEEGIPVNASRTGCRITACRADQVALMHAYTRALDTLLARTGTPLPRIGGPATRALTGLGIANLEHLLDWTRDELLATHGVGPKAVRIIEDALAEHGWRLPDSPRAREQ